MRCWSKPPRLPSTARTCCSIQGHYPPPLTDITQDDINRALDTASRIGDDYIQRNLGNGRVDTSTFTHGTSAQRQKWFNTGYTTGDPARCDTFGVRDLG